MKIKTKMDMIKAFAKLESICFTHLEALNDFADFDYKPIAVLEAELKATGKLDFGDAERENYDVFTEWLVDLMKDDEHWNIPNLSEGLATHFPDWKDYLVFGMEEELAWEMVGKLTNAFPPFNEWLRTEFYPETVDMLESVKEFADQFEDCFCPLVEYIVNNDGDSLMEYARKLEKITRGISCGRPSMKYFWSNEYIECLDVLDISNGLLFDTCKHIRAVRANNFSSYHLSGILIDSFVYSAIRDWHWRRPEDISCDNNVVSYEQSLVDFYNRSSYWSIYAPGSGMKVDASKDWDVLGKVLNKIAK